MNEPITLEEHVKHSGHPEAAELAIVVAFVIAAIVTPTIDPVTQSLVAGPIIVLYFLGIVLAWLVRPRARRRNDRVTCAALTKGLRASNVCST